MNRLLIGFIVLTSFASLSMAQTIAESTPKAAVMANIQAEFPDEASKQKSDESLGQLVEFAALAATATAVSVVAIVAYVAPAPIMASLLSTLTAPLWNEWDALTKGAITATTVALFLGGLVVIPTLGTGVGVGMTSWFFGRDPWIFGPSAALGVALGGVTGAGLAIGGGVLLLRNALFIQSIDGQAYAVLAISAASIVAGTTGAALGGAVGAVTPLFFASHDEE